MSMKISVHHLALLGLALSPLHAAEPAPVPRVGGTGLSVIPQDAGHPTAEPISDKEFSARRDAAAGPEGRPKAIPPVPNSYGLLEMSTVLESAGSYVLLPKGSVLWCPPTLQAKMVAAPSAKYSDWLSFFSANRAWITTYEVTAKQASGQEYLPMGIHERWKRDNLLVVATLQGGPISLPPPKP